MLHLVHTLNLRNFFFDFTDYVFVILIFSIFFSKKIIDEKMFLWVSVCSLGPFLFNHLLLEWWYMPDQVKYFTGAQKIREINFDIFGRMREIGKFTVILPSIIYGLFPIPFIETINSIGFINKCLLGLTTIYLFHKKAIDKNIFFLINIWPSIFFYSSISLKDTLSLILAFLFVYFLTKKNYFISLVLIILTLFIKIINFFLFATIFLTYFIFFGKDKIRIFNIAILIFLLFLSIYNFDYCLQLLNKHRFGFFEEANTSLKSYEEINFNIYFFQILILDLYKFIFSPFPNIKNYMILFQFLENIFIYGLLILLFKKLYKENKKKFIFWIFSTFYSLSLYSILVFSDGTIARYKYVILTLFIFAIYTEIKKDGKKLEL